MKKLVLSLVLSLFLGSCGGSGGSSTNVITPPVKIDNPDCFDVEGVPTYPESYNGKYSVPVPNMKLASNVVRAYDIKDLNAWFSKPINNTCDDKNLYLINLYTNIVKNLSQLHTDRIYFFNYGAWNDLNETILKIDETSYHIPKNIMQLIVNESKKNNIKVHSMWNMEYSDRISGFHGSLNFNSIDIKTMTKLLDSFKIVIVNHAKFAEQIGIAGVRIDPGYFPLPILETSSEAREVYVTKILEIIDEVRKVFKGSITYGEQRPILDQRILSKIDELNLHLFAASTIKTNITYEGLLNNNNAQINLHQKLFEQNLKYVPRDLPINWLVMAQSNTLFYQEGQWVEDGFCFTPCFQDKLEVDFSLQSMAVDSALRAINQQSIFKNNSVSFTYWTRGELVPTQVNQNTFTLPNISHSIRNKPSEKIVKYWYSK